MKNVTEKVEKRKIVMKTVSTKIPDSVFDEMLEICERERLSKNEFVRIAIAYFLTERQESINGKREPIHTTVTYVKSGKSLAAKNLLNRLRSDAKRKDVEN